MIKFEYSHTLSLVHPSSTDPNFEVRFLVVLNKKTFPGRQGIKDAYDASVSETGVTVHYVDEGIDTGEIIAQEKLSIPSNWTLNQLEEAVHRIEHDLYPATIQSVIEKGTI